MSPVSHDFTLDGGTPRREGYDTAQICLGGHCVNSSTVDYPRFNEDYCSRCGQPTITACRECLTPIRGYLRGSVSTSSYTVPLSCHQCGALYPWTEAKLATARDAARALETLSPEERQHLVQTLDDLVHDSSKTASAATRFRKLTAKAGEEASEPLRAMLMDIACDTAKQALVP